jgi:hypothetical protein
VIVVLAASLVLPAAPASAVILHLNGAGPLHLGMSRLDALDTGWISNRGAGCELGGPPIPIVYRLRGPKAPSSVRGNAEFRRGHLRNLSFSRGARTAVGVTVNRTSPSEMVARYRRAGYSASSMYIDTFQATFVTVRRGARTVISGFAPKNVVTLLGIPYIPVCD